MATSNEEILLRMGFDVSQVQKGTQAMLILQKKSAADYVDFWKKAIAQKESDELSAEVEGATRRNRARLLLRQRGLEQERRLLIEYNTTGPGALPSSWTDTAAGAAGGAVAGAGAMVGSRAVSFSGSMRASHAALRTLGQSAEMLGYSTFPRLTTGIMGSTNAMRALHAAGVATAATMATIMVAIAGIAAAGATVWQWGRMRGAQAQEAQSQANLNVSGAGVGARLSEVIDQMTRSGRLGKDEASRLTGLLGENPSNTTIRAIQRHLMRINEAGLNKESADAKAREAADKAYAETKQALDAIIVPERTRLQIEDDIADKTERVLFLKQSLKLMDKDSLEYHQDSARLAALELDLQKDKLSLQKLLNAGQAEANRLSGIIVGNEKRLGTAQAEYPTIENLAGRTFTSRLRRQYGPGGIYDLGTGTGPLAATAREYELAKYQQLWDRTHGNAAQAEDDRVRQMKALTKLSQAGAASPEQNMQLIADNTAQMRTILDRINADNKVLKTMIVAIDETTGP